MQLLPRPTSSVRLAGLFRLDETTALTADAATSGVASWLRGALGPSNRCRPASRRWLRPGRRGHRAQHRPVLGERGFPSRGHARACSHPRWRTSRSVLGAQALRQLLPPQVFRRARVADIAWQIPAGTYRDAPRFAWRGAMLDVARHFVPKNDVLRFIDLLAMHRLNVLHLHLTDDQGWRLEIARYPRLTEVGAWRRESQVGAVADRFDGRPHGGFYARDDIREIVAYAAERFVTVVPEIDVPGHSQAAIAAYPELGVTDEPLEVATTWGIIENVLNVEESTVEFFLNVLDEVIDLFPSADTVASWRSLTGAVAAARAGHDVVSCPDTHCYLDYRQSDRPDEPIPVSVVTTVEDVYAFNPVPSSLTSDEARHVLGGQCNVWTEYMGSARVIDYFVFPRLAAFAEAVWSAGDRDIDEFRPRLAAHLDRLSAYGAEYRRDTGPLPWQRRPGVPGRPEDRAERTAAIAAMTANLTG